MTTTRIPRDIYPDLSVPLMFDPYECIAKRARRNGSDLFRTRMMLRPTICMTGEECAKLFYDETKFKRGGAAPSWIQKTLFGVGGIQGIDDEEHKRRKRMFMASMSPDSIESLGETFERCLEEEVDSWRSSERIVLYTAMQKVLTRAVCEWAGIPLREEEVERRREELTALFDKAGGIGHFKARRCRVRAENWIRGLIEELRQGPGEFSSDTPLAAVSFYRDSKGELLPSKVAAVEVLNLLRPTVALSVYITFAAHALHSYPECAEKLRSVGEEYDDLFIQEVRRFYPFFPSVMAKVRQDFEWKGYRFKKGWTAVLDLHGTNHDPRSWDQPQQFRPERFREQPGSTYSFIPQGGGEHMHTHRCAGEFLTVNLMRVALQFLTTRIGYDVPEQDLSISMTRLPALPRSQFVISNVHVIDEKRHSFDEREGDNLFHH